MTMKRHDQLLLALNGTSQALLLVLCWYQGLIVFAVAVYALLSGVPVMIGLCQDIYYQTYGQVQQGRILLCTEYEGDGLDQQFLVAVEDSPSTAAVVLASHEADGRSGLSETTVPQWWIFNPACFTDHEHPDRPRWPAQRPGDVVDVIVLQGGCRMRDLRFDDGLQICGLGLGVVLFGGMGAVMLVLYVGVLMMDWNTHCAGTAGGGCCAWETKTCNLATLLLYLLNGRLWCLRKYDGDRLRALAKEDEDGDQEESELPTTTAAVVEQEERELV
jgi:hypothetical protein